MHPLSAQRKQPSITPGQPRYKTEAGIQNKCCSHFQDIIKLARFPSAILSEWLRIFAVTSSSTRAKHFARNRHSLRLNRSNPFDISNR